MMQPPLAVTLLLRGQLSYSFSIFANRANQMPRVRSIHATTCRLKASINGGLVLVGCENYQWLCVLGA